MKDILLARYFNAMSLDGHEPPEETIHMGFLQSCDFTAFTDITIFNAVSVTLLDAHIYNTLSKLLVMDQWAEFMTWDKSRKRWIIDPNFYTNFVNAFAAYLYTAEEKFLLRSADFQKTSAVDNIEREYGEKVIEYDYAKTKVVVKKEDDVETLGEREDTNAGSRTQSLYPLGASDFIDDKKADDDYTITTGEQENRTEYGDQTTEADSHKDTTTHETYTDEERKSKILLINPKDYFDIRKELISYNAFSVIENAVKQTICTSVWG